MNDLETAQVVKDKQLFLSGHFWLVLFVSIASIFGIGLLSVSAFDPVLVLALSIFACLLMGRYADIGYSTLGISWKSGFALILIVAAVLRSDVYPHMMGGQDQGLYTNYAEMMLKTGSLDFIDAFRKDLPGSLREIYDQVKMASVPLIDPDKSLMTIAFYPLHPMWMAVFGAVLGLEYKTLSLLLFSLIYIWSGKLLAEEIFDSKPAGTISALLLSINPLLVFFSKYPVTEMVGLAFSLSGYLYLIRGVNARILKVKLVYISLALFCFTAFFFVRFQFLMYLPFFGLLTLGLVMHDRKSHWQSGAIPALILITLMFALSLVWYFLFQRELFMAMFGGHFISLIDRRLAISIAVPVLVLLLVYYAWLGDNRNYTARRMVTWLLSKSGIWLLLSIMVSALSVIYLYQTASLKPFPWDLNTDDPFLFRYHAIYRYILFISPFAFIALVYGSLDKTFQRGLPGLLLVFLSTTILVTLIQPVIPYLYYYGRYLAGELVPYSLIVLGGILSIWLDNNRRARVSALLALIIPAYIIFLIPQYRFVEGDPLRGYDDFFSRIHKKDVVLAIGLDDRILVPLRLSGDKQIFAIKDWDPAAGYIKKLLPELQSIAQGQGGRLILLTHVEHSLKLGVYLGGAQFVNTFISNGEHLRSGYIQSPHQVLALLLPLLHVHKSEQWLFHDLSAADFDTLSLSGICPEHLDFSKSGNLHSSGVKLTNFSHQEMNGRWTDGDYAEIQCQLKSEKSYTHLKLSVSPYLPATHASRKITSRNVTISINDIASAQVNLADTGQGETIVIPISSRYYGLLKIGLRMHESVSPLEVGESQDARKLGLYVRSLRFE